MEKINILYVEDNEGDVLLLEKQLAKIDSFSFQLDNVSNYENFCRVIKDNQKTYDIYFIDYNLSGAKNGLDLVDDFRDHHITGPFILLTGVDRRDLHTASSRKGIYDYLLKNEITPSLLKRVITHSIARHIDFQQRLQREKSDHQNQKMQALGMLASGVAHEVNNLIQPIVLACDLLTPEAEKNPAIEKAKNIIFKNASRSSEIVKNILSFSRLDEGEVTSENISAAILNSLGFIRHLLPKQIVINRVGLEDNINEMAMINPNGLTHILTNILLNASQAMDKKGTITLTLANENPDKVVRQKFDLDENRKYISLSIKDQGHGIPDSIQEKVFDPFFTTKEAGEGTGLGLSIVYSIIKRWGAGVQVESKKGEGSTFTFFFVSVEDATV